MYCTVGKDSAFITDTNPNSHTVELIEKDSETDKMDTDKKTTLGRDAGVCLVVQVCGMY